MSNNNVLKQPYLGIISTLLCITVSLGICSLFDADYFGGWVTLVMVAMVPAQVVLGLVWGATIPGLNHVLSPLVKTLLLLAIMIIASLLVVPLALTVVGLGNYSPTPFVNMYIIFSVVITFWLVIVMQCWPVSQFTDTIAVVGIGVWLLTYVVAYVLFTQLFDFGFLQDAPFYLKELDPQGLFNAWHSLSFTLTTLVFMLALVLLDFWPVTVLASKFDVLGKQPFFGLFSTALILTASYCIWNMCVVGLGMDPVVYMVRVPVAMIFGQFIMLIMLKTAPFQTLLQPLKGLSLIASAAILSVLTYGLYAWAGGFLVGPLVSGAPEYQLDLWMASAMLAVTFPVLVIFADFLGYWPLVKDDTSQQSAENELA